MYQLVRATLADRDFIFEAFKASMKDYVHWAWGWDDEAQRIGLLSERNFALFQIIRLGENKIGALLLEETFEQHYLRTIFLLPQHHRQGIGSQIMQTLQQDAQEAMKPLGLRVIHTNPARKLYKRLGFKVIAQDEKTLLMQWQAAAS